MVWVPRNLSIRRKLTLITMSACGAAILVACAAFALYDLTAARRAMMDELQTQAAIIAGNSTASLSFADPNDAAGTLSGLREEPQVQVAALFNPEGKPLASFAQSDELRRLLPAAPAADGAHFGRGFLEVYRPVMLDGKRIGTVYLRCDLHHLYARIRQYFMILIAVVIGAYGVAWILVSRMQRFISAPILHLAETARSLSAAKDYSVRATKSSNDEIGLLTNAFNDMLHQVQLRDAELQAHRDQLEETVTLRTRELLEVNQHLAEEKDRAEQASRAKSAFLANMSHEIRTPMTAILGYSDAMLEPDRTASDQQDCLQAVRRNARHLLDLINDILDISKIEADKMSVERAPTDLPALLSDVISLIRPRASEKRLSFGLEVQGPVPRLIGTDPLRLRQVLLNLLGNAVKFTQTGSVRLRVSYEPRGEGHAMRFDVIDTGIGIAPQQLARLFKPFSQADESTTRKFGGTGLGLTISMKLAVLLGGEVTVDSRPGQGSTFTLWIDPGPLAGVEMIEGLTEALLPRPTRPASCDPCMLGGRILLVEDGPDNQRLISMHLLNAGAQVSIAENGRIGLEKVLAAAGAGKPFDLVLMDMQMPEMDGYAATAELRRRGQTLPILALTAHAMAHDRDKCLAAGCTEYLTKPVEKAVLLRTISQHLPPQSSSAPIAQLKSRSSNALRSTFADDRDMQQVLGEFVGNLPRHVSRLGALLSERNLEELRRAVHQLKGAGGGYGFAAITTAAAAAEHRIRSAATAPDPKSALPQLKAQVQELVELIRTVEGYDKSRETVDAAEGPGH